MDLFHEGVSEFPRPKMVCSIDKCLHVISDFQADFFIAWLGVDFIFKHFANSCLSDIFPKKCTLAKAAIYTV